MLTNVVESTISVVEAQGLGTSAGLPHILHYISLALDYCCIMDAPGAGETFSFMRTKGALSNFFRFYAQL